MHRMIIFTILILALVGPSTAYAFDPAEAFGMTTVVSGTSGIDAENPVIAGGLSLRPKLKLADKLSLGFRIDVNKEFTDDEGNNDRHETKVSNGSFTLSHSQLAAIGDLVTFSGMGRVYLPTSEAAQFQTLNTAVRFGGTVMVALAPATFTFSPYVQKNFHEFTTSVRENCPEGFECGTGNTHTSWSTYWTLGLSLALPAGVGLDLSYSLANGHGYGNNDTTSIADIGALGSADGELVGSHADADGRHQRFVQAASIGLSFDIAADVNLGVSIDNGWMPQLKPNARDLYNPLLAYQNYSNFTAVGLSLSYTL